MSTDTYGVMSLEEARDASIDDLRADIIRSAARGQGPTFIAAKLDFLIASVKAMKPSTPEHQWEFYANGSFCRKCGTQLGSGQPCR